MIIHLNLIVNNKYCRYIDMKYILLCAPQQALFAQSEGLKRPLLTLSSLCLQSMKGKNTVLQHLHSI